MEVRMTETISIENWDKATIAWIEKEAKRRGVSIEAVVLELIRQAISSAEPAEYHDLDALAGTWSKEQADEFLSAIADFQQVDEKLWQ